MSFLIASGVPAELLTVNVLQPKPVVLAIVLTSLYLGCDLVLVVGEIVNPVISVDMSARYRTLTPITMTNEEGLWSVEPHLMLCEAVLSTWKHELIDSAVRPDRISCVVLTGVQPNVVRLLGS
jgi:hypothetical protein